MIKLRTLTIQNFRSFIDAKIDFPDSGLVLIKGNVVETGESSGSGKSTIFLAISYVLDILPKEFTMADFQSWFSGEKPQVSLTLKLDSGEEVIFARGKKTFVQVGDHVTTGATPCKDKQQQILGFNTDILKALTYRAQRKEGLFLSLDPSEMVEFLTQVLNLGPIELAVDEAKKRESELDRSVAIAKSEVDILQKMLDVEKSKDIAEVQISSSSEEEAKLREVLGLLNKASLEIQANYDKVEETLKVTRKAIFEKKDSLLKGINNLDFHIREAEAASFKIEGIKAQVKTLESGMCHICNQPWVTEQAQAKKEELLVECVRLGKQIEGKDTLVLYKQKAKDEIAKLSTDLPVNEWIAEMQKNANTIVQVEARLQTFKFARDSHDALHRSKLSWEKSIKDLTVKLELANQKIVELNQRLNAEKDFVSMMGREGFLGVIFDDVLREIADETNERLSQMANVGSVRIGFQTEGVKKITPVVNIAGNVARLKTGPSGGMFASIEQVVDVAVMAVIGRRAGKMPGWLCLDEIFHGQGPKTLETAMDFLKVFAQDRLVLVIDHTTEFQEAFSQTINIENENGISKVL